jgi:hypothetical protein
MSTNQLNDLVLAIAIKERSAKRRAFMFTLIPIISACILVFITWMQVNYSQHQVKIARRDLDTLSAVLDQYKALRDRYMIEYLRAKGFSETKNYELLEQSIQADDLLSKLAQEKRLDTNVRVEYYEKTLDQEKVWLSLKESGYTKLENKMTTNPYLISKETNAVAVGSQVRLYDLKVILLTLIRAGFKMQHIYRFAHDQGKENMIQILRIAPATGIDSAHPLTVEKIEHANSVADLITMDFDGLI